MEEIKLIAIDIDGTLVNSKKEITPAVKKSNFDCSKTRQANRNLHRSAFVRYSTLFR